MGTKSTAHDLKEIQRLQQSEIFLKTILDSTEEVVAVFDSNLNCIIASKATCALLRKSEKELIGKHLLDLFPSLVASPSHRSLLRALSGEVIKNATSEASFTQDGWKYISNYTPVIDEGVVLAIVVITKVIKVPKA